jgi:hypothetical protein
VVVVMLLMVGAGLLVIVPVGGSDPARLRAGQATETTQPSLASLAEEQLVFGCTAQREAGRYSFDGSKEAFYDWPQMSSRRAEPVP